MSNQNDPCRNVNPRPRRRNLAVTPLEDRQEDSSRTESLPANDLDPTSAQGSAENSATPQPESSSPDDQPPPEMPVLVPAEQPKPVLSGGAAVALPQAKRKVGAKPKRQPMGDYAVGFAKPPEHGKIKPREVRNPRGRPSGAKGLNTIVRAAMDAKVSIRTGEGTKRVRRVEALFLKQVERGFAGNDRAITAVLQAYSNAVPERPIEDHGADAATAETDAEIIEAFRAMLMIGEPAELEEAEAEDITTTAGAEHADGGDTDEDDGDA